MRRHQIPKLISEQQLESLVLLGSGKKLDVERYGQRSDPRREVLVVNPYQQHTTLCQFVARKFVSIFDKVEVIGTITISIRLEYELLNRQIRRCLVGIFRS